MRDERDLPWLAAPLADILRGARGHALLLQGRGGDGVFELALRLAQAWLCEGDDGLPCDACPSCHLLRAGSHPDLRLLLPETLQSVLALGSGDAEEGGEPADGEGGKGKRKPSKDIRVEAVRQAIDWAHNSSARGRGKVMLLYPADAMNAVAANALLKTLEEPPAGMRLLLCVADPEHLLPTLRSRCQHLRLTGPAPQEAEAWLAAQGVVDAPSLLRACGGEPLAAEAAARQGWTLAAWSALPAQIRDGQAGALQGMAVPELLRLLQHLCHDAMAVAADATPRFFPPDSLPRRPDWPALADWSRELSRAVRQQDHPWNAGLRGEALLLQARDALRSSPAGARRTERPVATLRT